MTHIARVTPGVRALIIVLATASAASGQTATWYIPTYTHDILVWDEVSEQTVGRITARNFIPNNLTLTEARDRLYVSDATGQHLEVADLRTRRVVDSFTLSEGNVTVRIDGLAVHPSEDKAILTVKRYTRGRDRYTVEGPFNLEYDLRTKTVTDTLEWPGGEARDRGFNFRYAPDGKTLYYFADDVIALNADTYEEVDHWELSQPLEPGLGRPNVSLNPGTYDEPGVSTGLFRMTDPVQNRSMLGIATVHLSEKRIEFYTLGASEPLRQFVLAPGGEKGYALLSEVGHYEFWEFDLAGHRLAGRHPFAGRPRMNIHPSADGKKVYVYTAGNTIDVYDTTTFELLRTITFDADMTLGRVVVVPGPAPR